MPPQHRLPRAVLGLVLAAAALPAQAALQTYAITAEIVQTDNLLFVPSSSTLTGRFTLDTAAARLPPSPSFTDARFRAVTALGFTLGDFGGRLTGRADARLADDGQFSRLSLGASTFSGLVAPEYFSVLFAVIGIELAFPTGALGPITDALPQTLPLDQLSFGVVGLTWIGEPGPFIGLAITAIALVPTPVPEPAGLALLGAGLLGLSAARLSRRRPAPPA